MLTVLLAGMLTLAPQVPDTLSLTPAVVSAVKQDIRPERLASPSSLIGVAESYASGINRPLSLSERVPGLHLPDYGASMTSTIYIRGLGSRMENPTLGLYLDDIPVLDKNAYDRDWYGIDRATLLRGPQGTLYGRNSMGGVLLLQSLSGVDGLSATFEAGSYGHLRAGAFYGSGAHTFSASLRHSNGYFTNEYKDGKADPYLGGHFHWRWDKAVSERLRLSNSLHISASDEGGFAYGLFSDGALQPVNYNDEGSYRRLSVLEGLRMNYRGDRIELRAIGSLQLLLDRMRMDQDFTPASVFTLEQQQRSGATTLEIIATPVEKFTHWKPQTGFFAFGRANAMSAPVVFKADGIQSLILDNANRNIPSSIGYLDIAESSFPVTSDFGLHTWNAALYHESVFTFGRWILTAGLRLDYEGGRMDYDSRASIHYRFVPTMPAMKAFETRYDGTTHVNSLQLAPKLSALYELPLADGRDRLSPYANLSKGFRAGGFNTQIFSDILQGQMMNGIMSELGVYFDNPTETVGAEQTRYKPETAWNYELGVRYRNGNVFRAEANAYYIDCRNQQLTVFPPGKSTGRMMTNAGRSESLGIETEMDLRKGDFHVHLSYSWCRATFRSYDDGHQDYAGNRVPYAPEHSCYFGADYRFRMAGQDILARADLRGAGPVWWNEANTLKSDPTLTLGAMLTLPFEHFDIYLRGDNLTGEQYRTFYFKSVGKEFFALSKPRRITIGINLNL